MSFFQAHVSVSADLVKATIKFIAIDEIQSGSLFCNWDYIGSEYSVTSVERSLSLVLMSHDRKFSIIGAIVEEFFNKKLGNRLLLTVMILSDLHKLFDTIDKDTLLKKLRATCFPNNNIGQFKSNLLNRLFRANLENCYLNLSIILCGVPQGPILVPLVFQIYVNDMPQAIKSNLFL